jgi:NitT/TauT family transport system ATP-binding protein
MAAERIGLGPGPSGLSLRGLGLVYASSRGPVPALRDVSFEVPRGSFVSVLGPSGCGKSTILKLASGLLAPSEGEVLLDGRPVRGPRPDVGIVFQKPTLLPWKTVRDNVLVPIRAMGRSPSLFRAKADRLLGLVGLSAFADHYPGELSGGMQQRVGLARALATEPDVLLMDEPFGALDELTRGQMQDELLQIWESERKTVLFVTHSMDEAILVSDRIVVMKDGMMTNEYSVPIPRPRSRHVLLADPVALELKRELIDAL